MNQLVRKSFLLSLAFLLCVELVLRLALPKAFTDNFYYGLAPSQGFEESVSGMVSTIPSIARDFHRQTFSRTPTSGVFRIIILGDSVEYWSAVGLHVLQDTYPLRLQQELKARGMECECINLAVTGYGSLKNEALFQQVLQYQPGLIILKLNTINEGTDEAALLKADDFRSWKSRNWLQRTFLVSAVSILKEKFLTQKLLGNAILAGARNPSLRSTGSGPNSVVPLNERQLGTVRRCMEKAREKGVPVLLVCQAFREETVEVGAGAGDRGLEQLAGRVTPKEAEIFLMKSVLQPYPPNRVFADHVHLTPFGHELMARELAVRIIQLNGVAEGKKSR